MPETLPAAILAAGRISAPLQRATGATAKALMPAGGRPIIDKLLDAVLASSLVGEVKVVCAAGSPLLEHVGQQAVATAGPGFLDSIRTGLEALGKPEKLLLITGDLPLLTPEALDHFCREALQSGSSIVYPIVSKDDCERVFPGGRRTFVRLSDGAYTGGNVGVVSRAFVETQGERLARAFAGRKNPLRLCAMFGWGFVLRLMFGRLTVSDLVARGEEMLGANIHVVRSPYPEIGFDVDKPSNLASVEAWLTRLDED